MRNSYGRMGALVRAVACALIMLGVASPAAAQFGGLKKKLKSAAGQEAATEGAKQAGVSDQQAAAATGAGNAGATGGTVVLTPEVVDQLLAGLKASKAYRDSARTGENSFGRYNRAVAAFDSAKAKCEASHTAFINRMATDEKLANQYSEITNKMAEAMGKGDRAAAERYQNQALAMQDQSCTVKEPTRPDDYSDSERDIDTKAEQEGVKKSGLSATEFAMARERGEGILYDAARSDVSESEKKAVKAKSKELKPLLGIRDPETERARKPAPEPAPAPTPEPTPQPAPGVNQAQQDMNNCMMNNVHKHEKEIEALGERAKAAQEAGDMNATLAISDTLRRLQMAGCEKSK